MSRYLTGLITTDYWRYPPFPYSTRHWRLHLVRTTQSKMSAEISVGDGRRSKETYGKEVVIEARNDAAAKRVGFMLDAAAQVWDASALLSRLGSRIELKKLGVSDSRRGVQHRAEVERRATRSNTGIPLECLLAIKAARRRNWVYALSKLWLSYEVFSVPAIDLDPSHSPRIPRSVDPVDHVSCATAIVLAYGAIEELGFEIRASQKRPSTINGDWNPVVKEELESRLNTAGIDLRENYDWQVRGARTVLERERPPRRIRRSPWARWDVRDTEVTLVDAIAHLSWLRSKVSAHALKYEFARALSVYDVANAQFLARRLLLDALGFWRSAREKDFG